MVKVNNEESEKGEVLSGVPQGSVLGPLLFVLYINDLPESVCSSLYLFADDTKLLKTINNVEDSLILQKDIDALEEWSRKWLLKFHPDKCHVLTIGKLCNIAHAHPYALENQVLEHVFSEKDLGVTFDSNLTFEEHIMNKIKKANSMVGMIRRSFSYLSPDLFRQLYSTFVRPHLEYAQVVWHPKLRKHSNLIEGVQRRATKIVASCKNLSYEDRLKIIGIPTLDYRRAVGDMVEVYKHLHHYDTSSIPAKFTARTRPSRNHDFKLNRNFGNDGLKGIQTNSFYYRSIVHWNNLPKEVVSAPSVAIFKKRLNSTWK